MESLLLYARLVSSIFIHLLTCYSTRLCNCEKFITGFSDRVFKKISNENTNIYKEFKAYIYTTFAGYEVCERMAYYGIATNLVLYLTREMKEGTVKSSNSVTNWVGTVWITPILGAYIADTYLGRYWTFMVASVIYLVVRKFHHFS